MAHCLRGLLAALGQSDPAAVAACLAAAEGELEAAVARHGAEADADLSEEGVGREGERERVFASTLRAWSAGRWREVRLGGGRGVRVVVVVVVVGFSIVVRPSVAAVHYVLEFLRRLYYLMRPSVLHRAR